MYPVLTFSVSWLIVALGVLVLTFISQKGPFEIQLMVGEYKVFRSIIEYSIPKLVGWSTMFDRNVEQAVSKSVQNAGSQRGGHGGGSPHNYQGGGGGY